MRFGFLTALLLPAALLAQAPAPAPAPKPPAREPGLYVTFQTTMGPIVARLFEKEAPKTVKNFADLAQGRVVWTNPATGLPVKRPFYDGLIFHRVIPNFMIQGGDPLANGTGGTKPIPDEIDTYYRFDQPGRLGMANSGPDTGSCQFFITEVPTPHLNGKHTIFGQVTEGLEIVAAIARVPRNDDNLPLTPVKMTKVTIQRVGPAVPAAKPVTVSKKAAPGAPAPAAKKAAAPATAPKTTKAPATLPKK